ncbi:hypothetical protein [Halomonas sp. M20]|uniref:hypothetical protein n=1 Tax=Halomonas sp. M20 TaxID=2763264 RepID=UPI001D0A4B9D|nr:hypothetical protein [Halomonas sp. M20]
MNSAQTDPCIAFGNDARKSRFGDLHAVPIIVEPIGIIGLLQATHITYIDFIIIIQLKFFFSGNITALSNIIYTIAIIIPAKIIEPFKAFSGFVSMTRPRFIADVRVISEDIEAAACGNIGMGLKAIPIEVIYFPSLFSATKYFRALQI